VKVKKLFICLFAFVFIFMCGLQKARGAGFLIYEHGAAAMGIAGAFVAVANNPTAVFHNPAGIAFLKGTQVSLGTTLITSNASLALSNWPDPRFQKVEPDRQWFYPSTFYITHSISDNLVAGFGFFSPYGLGLRWPDEYPLRYISVEDDMKTFIFNPTIAYKVSENFSLGFGVSYIYATLQFRLSEFEQLDIGPLLGLPVPIVSNFEVPVTLDASGSAFGLNAGALYKGENYSVGVNWRGGFNIDFEGDLDLGTPLVQIPPPYDQLVPPGQIEAIIPSQGDAATSFSFPHILGIGMAFNPTEMLTLSLDFHYILWSSYDEFIVAINAPLLLPPLPAGVDVPGFEDKEVVEDWENAWIIRGGAEYWVSESFALRLGAFYDKAPQPVETMDPILPDADRIGITGGLGYRSGNFVINLAYQYEPFKDRTSPNRELPPYQLPNGINLGEGTYSNTAHLFGLSIGYIF
jgi:long-chain fatty acid transport protein